MVCRIPEGRVPLTPSNQHSDEARAEAIDIVDRHTRLGGTGKPRSAESAVDALLEWGWTPPPLAFDRGRESKQHTDRETLGELLWQQQVGDLVIFGKSEWSQIGEVAQESWRKQADYILAALSLSLVAVRDEVARLYDPSAFDRVSDDEYGTWPDAEPGLRENYLRIHAESVAEAQGKAFAFADALFASGLLKPSSEVEAAGEPITTHPTVGDSAHEGPWKQHEWPCDLFYTNAWEASGQPSKGRICTCAARVRSGKDDQ